MRNKDLTLSENQYAFFFANLSVTRERERGRKKEADRERKPEKEPITSGLHNDKKKR